MPPLVSSSRSCETPVPMGTKLLYPISWPLLFYWVYEISSVKQEKPKYNYFQRHRDWHYPYQFFQVLFRVRTVIVEPYNKVWLLKLASWFTEIEKALLTIGPLYRLVLPSTKPVYHVYANPFSSAHRHFRGKILFVLLNNIPGVSIASVLYKPMPAGFTLLAVISPQRSQQRRRYC